MAVYDQLFKRISYAMYVLSGMLLVAMMFITLADVLSRGLFQVTSGVLDLTFIGGVELIKYALLMVVLFSFPHSLNRAQVVVDLFTEDLSNRAKNALQVVYMTGFMLLALGMSYRFYHAIAQSLRSGETTQDLLIPMYYLYGVSFFATAMLALSALRCALHYLFNLSEDNSI